MDKAEGQAVRPRQGGFSAAQGEATRRAILAAAAALIAEVGWCEITTRAIAERAGVPHGAIGYHFTGKADLLRQAALAAVRDALAAPIALVGEVAGVAELVTSTLAWLVAGGLAEPAGALLLEATREAVRDAALRQGLARQIQTYREAVTALALRDQQRGAIPAGVPAAGVGAVVAALLDGLGLHLALDATIDTQPIADAVEGLLGGEPR